MKTEELMLKNRNGKRMPATLWLPEGKPKGLVVILHGLGGWKDQGLHKLLAHYFVYEGYATFRFSESDAIVSPDNDFFNETTTGYLHDLEDVFAYVKGKSWAKGPCILIGHSMGGLIAARYAAEHPKEISELILIAPAVSWKMMWWSQLPYALFTIARGHIKILGIEGRKYVLSPLWWNDFFTFDGSRDAPHISVPTLVISAEEDGTVAHPFEHRSFTKRFPRAEHSTIAWADHDFSGHENEVVDTIRQWRTSS